MVTSVLLYQPEKKLCEQLSPSLHEWSAATTSFLPQRATDRQRDGRTTQNYSSTGIFRINISCKNTPSGQEQKNQQVHQGATGGRHVCLPYLEPVFRGIISSFDLCEAMWISICGFSNGPRVEGPLFDVFINLLVCKMHHKVEGKQRA